jgi:gliding motility-associated-like protein
MFRRFVAGICLICYSSSFTFSQVCDGNLGENIFTAGDFGSGSANILATDPMIAPGYAYSVSPPPFDGLYTLSNNTAAWANLFESWLEIPDNSSDPNGYMMVINASFEPGLFYEQQVDDLCENTLYEFSADVINMIKTNVLDHIKPNVSFLIDGAVQYSTGDIPQNETWNTYGFTFTTGPGQTSVVLSLQNNAPGGIGNDLALDNITFRPCGPLAQILPEDVESICEDGNPTVLSATITGGQYDTPAIQWQTSLDGGATWQNIPGANGMTYTHNILSSGFYYYRYLLANGSPNLSNSKCRVVSNVKIVEVVPKFWFITDTLCAGLTYLSGDQSFTETGVYVDSLISSIGCDSIVTFDLTFIEDLGISADIDIDNPICSGGASGSILVSNVSNAYAPFEILLNGEVVIEGTPLNDLDADTYFLTIADQYACSFETLLTINDPTAFVVEVGPDQTVSLGSSVDVNPVANLPIADFNWSPEIGECPIGDCLDFSFIPTMSNTYVLTAFSDLGCISVDSLFIEVEDLRQVYFPNLFSPNGDGANDYFIPYVGEPNVLEIERLQVFNRWGALIYDGQSLAPNAETSGWDGTFKGEPAGNGVYVYLAEILFLDGQVRQYSGEIALLR